MVKFFKQVLKDAPAVLDEMFVGLFVSPLKLAGPIHRSVKVVAHYAIILAVVAFYWDWNDRGTDRAVRRATMLAIIVQVAATAEGMDTPNPVVPILETLVREKMDLSRLPLPKANLSRAELNGGNLVEANLSGAELRFVKLIGANLTGAFLWDANLTGTDLTGADLTDAKLAGAKLTQEQLDSACISRGGAPPVLPKGLNPPQKVCGS